MTFHSVARTAGALAAVLLLAVSLNGADNQFPAFYTALRANDLAALDALLAKGADLNAADRHGVTPLMAAAAVGSVDAMQRLLDHGAKVDARNEFGSTALMWSVTDRAKVRLLLQHHADVDATSEQTVAQRCGWLPRLTVPPPSSAI